jgi:peptidyl-prolyl cis-trans isomerase SDCCAG10
MEGYYDGLIFHRIVENFIVQTGDPTGTGNGGESFYGGQSRAYSLPLRVFVVVFRADPRLSSLSEPFEDEPHQRLKFSRRGLVGMANNQARSESTLNLSSGRIVADP